MRFLVIVDMQNDFITGTLGSSEAAAIVPAVVNKVKNFDGAVLFTKDTHLEGYEDTIEGKMIPPHCTRYSDGCNIVPELKEIAARGTSILKCTFGTKQIEKAIRDYAMWDLETVDSIELCGVCTDICVISNALMLRSAFPEVPIIVDAKCCAGLTPEKHAAALSVMESCLIDIVR